LWLRIERNQASHLCPPSFGRSLNLLRMVGAIELDRCIFKSATAVHSMASTGSEHQNDYGVKY